MMSVEMTRVWKVAEEMNAKLRADDPRLRSSVLLVHEDGTVLHYANAYLIEYYDKNHGDWGDCSTPGQWVMVFTEHHGFHVYPTDDLLRYTQFQDEVKEIERHPDWPPDAFICKSCELTFIGPIKKQDGGRMYHACPICGHDDVRPLTHEDRDRERLKRWWMNDLQVQDTVSGMEEIERRVDAMSIEDVRAALPKSQ